MLNLFCVTRFRPTVLEVLAPVTGVLFATVERRNFGGQSLDRNFETFQTTENGELTSCRLAGLANHCQPFGAYCSAQARKRKPIQSHSKRSPAGRCERLLSGAY